MTPESLETDAIREARIDRYGLLDEPMPDGLQHVVELAALVCRVPFAAVNLVTGDRQHQVAAVGVEPSICERRHSMCAVVLEQPPLSVPDASLDERFSDNPFVTGTLGHVRFYASAPMVTPDDITIGRLCVFDDRPREMSDQEQRALAALARAATTMLELRLRSVQLESSLDELTRTRDELRRSNEHLGSFAGQVAHDLRSPLTAIMANAELLGDDPAVATDPLLRKLADEVVDGGMRMAAMIDGVLAHAQSAGRLHLADTDLEVLVAEVLNDLASTLRQRDATVRVGVLPTVHADATQIYSVLLNLVDNAVKYSGDGPALVTIEGQRVVACGGDGGAAWRVTVTDKGIGIPPERQGQVFDPHVRVGDPAAGNVPGSGLGLDTVRRVVEAHGGRLGLDSIPGEGTAVWFELPDQRIPRP